MILDVSSRYKTPAPSSNKNNIANFADVFQKEDLSVENLTFERENKNNKIKDENGVIKNEEQTKLRIIIPNNLPFTIVISQRQGNKKINNNTKRYDLRRSTRKTK